MNKRPLVEELANSAESPYTRYLNMFVGQNSFGAFLKYELLTSLLGPMPGAGGYFLRAKLYRHILRQLGKGSVIGRSVLLRSPGQVSIGDQVMIDDNVVLDAKGKGARIELGNQILLGRNTILSCNKSEINIGSFVSIGPFCFFVSKSLISIGSNVSIGSGSHLMGGGHKFDDLDKPIIRQERTSQGIVVSDNVWIGSQVVVLDGVTLGEGCIVGAGAVVTKDVPAYSIAAGIPAKVIRSRLQEDGQE
jgi:acetyltransferase-like isoleucine patch superfamily enzyme